MRRWAAWLALALSVAGCDDGAADPAVDALTPLDAGADAARLDASPLDADRSDVEPPPDARPRPDAGSDARPSEPARLAALPETGRQTLPGLRAPVHVVYVEMGIPHLYAADEQDLMRALGYVVARDRYFVMDLQRRLGLGTLSSLLGDVALDVDLESRLTGITTTAARLEAHLDGPLGERIDAFAAGVNAYIDAVGAGEARPPSELVLARGLLGAAREVDLMHPWARRDVAAMAAVVLYQTNFETSDVGRQAKADAAVDAFLDPALPDQALRRAGFQADLWDDLAPMLPYASAAGLGLETAEGLRAGPAPPPSPPAGKRGRTRAPRAMLERLVARLDRQQRRLGRRAEGPFGSNAWAVAASATTDGWALAAGDGHLQLSVPALMYQVGLDTRVLGGGDLRQVGLLLMGLPVLAVGTNGDVAWSQVNPVVDITDWYSETLRLGPDGRPEASLFQGEWRPLVPVEETFDVADVPALDSVGREARWTRYTTFDGRLIVQMEGAPAADGDAGAVITLDGPVVPAALDGQVAAISVDHGALDVTRWIEALDRMGRAPDVEGFRQAAAGLVGGGLFSAAADRHGDVLFTSYQAVPCRTYLPRTPDGAWAPGADPTQLLDGTRFGAFRLPTDGQGHADEAPGAVDPHACVVPFATMPQAVSPAAGFVVTANNDPGGLTHDGRIDDDGWYLGGPWYPHRAFAIARRLRAAIDDGRADADEMARIQGDHASILGETFTLPLVAAVDAALAADAGPLSALATRDRPGLEEASARLRAWAERGYHAASGVETFYAPTPDAATRDDAVATMVFNAWLPRFKQAVFDDEPLPGWRFSASRHQMRALRRFVLGRGPDNPLGVASHDPARGESVFFDVVGTEAVESSDAVMVAALLDALEFLRGPPAAPGEGGFGTADMDAWLWGMRHQTEFESLLADFLADDPTLGALLQRFSITTRTLPLLTGLPRDDPRRALTWFPRPGDNWGIDAAGPGFSGARFRHGSGPVMRLVVALKDGEVRGRNIVPGGQSALTDSPHFADQARLWLANETVPMRYTLDAVIEGATGRELFEPAP